MTSTTLVLALVLIVSMTIALAATQTPKVLKSIDPVSSLDLPAYLGLWYQMYADKVVINSFEKNSFCDTALYGDNGDGTISVHNYATIGAPNGTVYTIDGYAYVPDASEPGKLKVHFDSDDAAPFDAPYWILELGPKNSKGLYDWAIVSDNLDSTLFILARDVETFNTKYAKSVLAECASLGFTGFKAPIALYQESDCVYEADQRKMKIAQSAAMEKLYKETL